jgi:hypothetical protein
VSESWIRRGLFLAGAWNIVGGGSALLDPTRHFAQMYAGSLSLADPIQAFFFRCVWINVIAWGIGYVIAGFRPGARGPLLLAGGLGKLAYFAACVALFRSGGGNTALLTAGIVDLAFAASFFHILWHGRSGATRPADT